MQGKHNNRGLFGGVAGASSKRGSLADGDGPPLLPLVSACLLPLPQPAQRLGPRSTEPPSPPCPLSPASYDIEDAIVMNRASLDRGFGRCIVLRKYGTSLKKYANRTQVGGRGC